LSKSGSPVELVDRGGGEERKNYGNIILLTGGKKGEALRPKKGGKLATGGVSPIR